MIVLRFLCGLVFCSLCYDSLGQKEYNIWYFGNQSGFDFNAGGVPQVLSNTPMQTFESASGICDKNGNLLFYTNGDTIYNRLHKPMKNGIFTPLYLIQSCAQGSMVLPVLGKENLYYVFHNSSNEHQFDNPWLSYSLVDMNGDNGYGEVSVAREPLLPRSHEAMSFALHKNGKDYWVASQDMHGRLGKDKTIICVRTVNGVIDTQKIKSKYDCSKLLPNNLCKFSPDSKIFAGTVSLTSSPGPSSPDFFLNLFKFDNATGEFYDSISFPHMGALLFFGEFSPGSRYLYVNEYDNGHNEIKQYDLLVWGSSAVENSSQIVFRSDSLRVAGMQLGPDGKIYIFYMGSDVFSVINYPDLKGSNCNVEYATIKLPHKNNYGGPYYPNFWFRRKPHQSVSFCQGDSAVLDAGYPAITKFKWNTGDTTPTITVKTAGLYSVSIEYGDTSFYNTIEVTVKKPFQVYLGSDTAFCGHFQHLLDAGVGASSYLWNTGDTTVTKLVDMPGMYAVTVKDSNSCENGDTILIEQVTFPPITKNMFCDSTVLTTTHQSKSIKYLWNTGDTGASVTVYSKGTYKVTASSLFCSITDSVIANIIHTPKVELGPDIDFCDGSNLLLEVKDTGRYLWSTGDTTSFINVSRPGRYKVTVSREGCEATDSIDILCDMWFYIPNAFTPGKDGINDGFGVTGENITSVSMKIFSRWGELLYEKTGPNPLWDGTYKNVLCPDGVYMYLISVKGLRKGKLTNENIGGNVTLLR